MKETDKDLFASDTAIGSDAAIVHRFHSAALLQAARVTSRLTAGAGGQPDEVPLAIATLLTASAALETLLLEVAFVRKSELYEDDKFRRAGAPKKFSRLTGMRHDETAELWDVRVALMHGEPHHDRNKEVGAYLNADRASWAVGVVETVARLAWAEEMPEWFRDELDRVSTA